MAALKLAAILLVIGLTLSESGAAQVGSANVTAPDAPRGSSARTGSFTIYSEVQRGEAAMLDARLREGLANGATLHPPLGQAEYQLLAGSLPFVYFSIPEEAGVALCYPNSVDPATSATLASLDRQYGPQVQRSGMPEFDQSGGCWARDRPSVADLSDDEAYALWSNYYLDTKGLRRYLTMSASERGYDWLSVCANAFCPQFAFDLGSDAVLLERNNDELSGLTPGLAMVRGAAKQHENRAWGVDISTHRYWTGGSTIFDKNGRLVSGWSPSTFERTMYAAYMAGADMIQNEAADYTTGAVTDGLNPLGLAVRDFADFALRRHPDRGTPLVSMALIQNRNSGFEPAFGEFDQAPLKWYQDNPYSPGDRMLAGMLKLAYPDHESWGTIPPGSPWAIHKGDSVDVAASQAAFRRFLRAGGDPRQYEPMGNTRWGESVDVLDDRAPLSTLLQYSTIVLSTSRPVGEALWADLREYVRRGGNLVVNARQLPPQEETFAGLHLTPNRGHATNTVWENDGSIIAEKPYDYMVAIPQGASVLARTSGNDPVLTRHNFGAGIVYVATPDYLLDSDGDAVLATGAKLLDGLQSLSSPVDVEGRPLQYLVNTSGPRIIVTLINTDLSGAPWTGTLRFRTPSNGETVREWITDTMLSNTVENGDVVVRAAVPPYGVRVIALEPSAG